VNASIVAAALVVLLAQAAQTPFAPGQVVASVATTADASQTYALYLPSQYRADRAWPLLMAFHPSARGRAFVDLYREVAEEYGYIVVASNNSRNGPWEPSLAAAQAVTQDVGARFSIDPARFYMTGFSGGARVAMQLALTSGKIAGVIASGGGFPDGRPRREVGFDVAGTVGLEDFNYLELRAIDRELTSPHRVFAFEGGHTLPPPEVARRAIEWLELRAMARGSRPKDAAVIGRWFTARVTAADEVSEPHVLAVALTEIAQDFRGLIDVSGLDARAASLMAQPGVERALAEDRARDHAEQRLLTDIVTLESQLRHPDERAQALVQLRSLLHGVHARATARNNSPNRRSARRVLLGISSGVSARVNDAEYLKLLQEFRVTAG
jgi:hypothetical protein